MFCTYVEEYGCKFWFVGPEADDFVEKGDELERKFIEL